MKPSVKRKKSTRPRNMLHLRQAMHRDARTDAAVPSSTTIIKRYDDAGLALDPNRVIKARPPGKVGADDVAGGEQAAIAAMKERLATETRDVAGTLLKQPELPAEHRVRVSASQARYLHALREKHGTDLSAMRRDSHLNYDQLSEGQLRKLFIKFDQVYPPGRPIPVLRLSTYANSVLDELADQVVQDFKRRRVARKKGAATQQDDTATTTAVVAAASTTSSVSTPVSEKSSKAAAKTPKAAAATPTASSSVAAVAPASSSARKRKNN
jgi:hypothetical protein